MDTLAINISWEFFLGLLSSLIAIAYYSNGRFTALETDVGWLKDAISELLISAENIRTKLFKNGSPVSLTPAGYLVLQPSGLKPPRHSPHDTILSSQKLEDNCLGLAILAAWHGTMGWMVSLGKLPRPIILRCA
jgi:hypothetical protein